MTTAKLSYVDLYPNGQRECHGDYRTESDLEIASQPLYAAQDSLPKLPVPSLHETCALYLQTVQPLVSEAEFLQTKRAVDTFIRPNGLGETLQQRLLQRATERKDTSWLAEWWNVYGYLQVRDPVVVNVSYFFHFSDSEHAAQRSQIGRAASLIRATMLFRQQIVDGTLPPERIGRAKTPLCATAYKYMFNACRIPRRDQDSYRLYDPSQNNHIIVMRHNKFFSLELVVNGRLLSFDEICHKLTEIKRNAGGKESAIGVLSSNDRDVWAADHAALLRNGNGAALNRIESSVFMVNLDDTAPLSRQSIARALWHGDGMNRFYDKIIQLVVFENGKAGILAEHSMLDGMAMTRYADYILTGLKKGSLDMGSSTSDVQNASLPSAVKLDFTMDSDILRRIDNATLAFQAMVDAHEVCVESFYGYGKELIKTFKCSPDAFVQMCIQLAYRKFFGTNRATYESSQVRVFHHGRTETTRSLSNDCVKWTKMMTSTAGGQPGKPSLEKSAALRKAVQSHVDYMKLAAKGKGVDRHLLGLQLCLKEDERHEAEVFSDPAYKTSKHWSISTSHLTHELFDGWGWGEVVPDGFGVAYSIKKESIHFNIACRIHGKEEWAQSLAWYLEESLLEMRDLMLFESQQTASKL